MRLLWSCSTREILSSLGDPEGCSPLVVSPRSFIMRFFQWLGSRHAARSASRKEIRSCRLEIEALEDRSMVSTLYGIVPGNVLIRFDSASPGTIQASVNISGLQSVSERIIGIDFRPRTGQLYASTVPI